MTSYLSSSSPAVLAYRSYPCLDFPTSVEVTSSSLVSWWCPDYRSLLPTHSWPPSPPLAYTRTETPLNRLKSELQLWINILCTPTLTIQAATRCVGPAAATRDTDDLLFLQLFPTLAELIAYTFGLLNMTELSRIITTLHPIEKHIVQILATKSAKPAAALSSNSSSGLHFALVSVRCPPEHHCRRPNETAHNLLPLGRVSATAAPPSSTLPAWLRLYMHLSLIEMSKRKPVPDCRTPGLARRLVSHEPIPLRPLYSCSTQTAYIVHRPLHIC